MIAVRPAEGDDRELLIVWCLGLFADLKEAADDPWFEGALMSEEQAAAYVDAGLANARVGRGPLLLALLDGEPAGYLQGRIEAPYVAEAQLREVGHISIVRVVPEARGRGVARALVEAAAAWFKERGLTWVQLSWHPGNRAATETWARLGFEPFRVFGRKRL